MNKCTNCNIRPGVIQLNHIFGESANDEMLCMECFQKKAMNQLQNLPGFNDFNLNSMLDMVNNMFNADYDDSEHAFEKEETKTENKEEKKKTTSRPSFQQKVRSQGTRVGRSILNEYCTDLTQLARDGEIDPTIGRNKEIDRIIHILNRRTKNNPVLIGEPGVGKTAIAEGLALKISQDEVPEKLLNKTVLSLDITAVTAGTMYRGMFEERMKKIAKEIEKRDDIILFIDELHMIMGAGSSMESNMDAANILKPYLARGKMQMIGATTLEEYRKIEKDSALERRFQMVKVEEPTLLETIEILKGLRSYYENFHQISYSNDAIEACAKLADRYISDRFMPDKAIDLMDEVGSEMNLKAHFNQNDPRLVKIKDLDEKEKTAALTEDYQKAMGYRQQRMILEAEIEKEKDKICVVRPYHIERVIEKMTGIPVVKLNNDERKGLSNLNTRLSENVAGQTEAVEAVVKAIKRSRVGVRKSNKPITFLFAGPTGVGKTELTKQIAKEVLGDKDAVIRFDMSEYMEEHSVSKLIGSPPGYVGHEDAGQLTEKVRRRPYSVILLDEIEKANNKVLNILLQLFDEGRLTDSHGTTVDFSNTIIVMTSNLGVDKPKTISLNQVTPVNHFEEAVKSFFRPELLNRIDKIVPFNHLKQEDLLQIVDLMLVDVVKGLEEKNISFSISDNAKLFLSHKGYNEKFGARPLARTIIDYIDDPITDLLIEKPSTKSISFDLNETKDGLVIK